VVAFIEKVSDRSRSWTIADQSSRCCQASAEQPAIVLQPVTRRCVRRWLVIQLLRSSWSCSACSLSNTTKNLTADIWPSSEYRCHLTTVLQAAGTGFKGLTRGLVNGDPPPRCTQEFYVQLYSHIICSTKYYERR